MVFYFSICQFWLEKLVWPGKLSTYSESRGESFSSVWSKLLKFLLSCESIKYYPDLRFSLSASKTCKLFQLFVQSNFKNLHTGWTWSKQIPPAQPGMWKFSPTCLCLLYKWCGIHSALSSPLFHVFGLCQLHTKLSLPWSPSLVPAVSGQLSPSIGLVGKLHWSRTQTGSPEQSNRNLAHSTTCDNLNPVSASWEGREGLCLATLGKRGVFPHPLLCPKIIPPF